MKVETYEVISDDPSQGDNALTNELESAEAVVLIESLGLAGQRKLLVKIGDADAPIRNPYRQMTQAERNIYGVMCPKVVELSEYEEGPIPIRVLQVAAHAKEFFPRLEVWCDPGSRDDPLLVGADHTSTYSVKVRHLLARWGDVLYSMDELIAKAVPRIRADWERQVREGIEKRTTFLASMDAQIMAHLNGQPVSLPNSY